MQARERDADPADDERPLARRVAHEPKQLGDGQTFGYNVFGSGYDYRASVGPWFRDLWFDPHPSLMADAPIAYQLHAAIPWLL